MFIQRALKGGVCLTAMLTASTAMADITAQQALDAWQDQMTRSNGITVTYDNAISSGNTLTVTGIGVELDDAQMEGVEYEISLDSLVFIENGDGTVTNKVSSPLNVRFGENGDYASNGASVSVDLSNGESVFSGTPEDLTVVGTYPTITLSVDSVTEFGQEIPMELIVTLNGVSTSNREIKSGDQVIGEQSGSIATTDMLVSYEDGGEGLNLSGKIMGMSYSGNSVMPADMSDVDPADFMSMGIVGEATFTTESAQILAMIEDFSGVTNVSYTHNGGETTMTFDEAGVGFKTAANDMAIQMAGGAVPLPIDVTLGQLGMDMLMPLAASDEPVDFGLGFDVIDLGVNEMIWSMIDPTGALPHDPITVQLGLNGSGKLFFDLTDPDQADAMAMGAVPGEIYSASIDRLKIALAGAMITGAGDFTFDNSDMMTIPGMPRPEGSLTLTGEGINGLLDKVSQMGLPVGEQIMGARMMLGMFTTVTGDDQIESTIEVNDQGHVLVNGQRMR